MVSLKVLAITMGIAIGAQASADQNADFSLELTKLSNDRMVWSLVQQDIHEMFPGITCTLGGPASPNNATRGETDWCKLIEQSVDISDLHCTGKLQDDSKVKALQAIGQSQRRETGLAARRDDPQKQPGSDVVEPAKKKEEDLINNRENSALFGCNKAPHPDACQSCIRSAAEGALSDVIKCGTEAYNAFKTEGTNNVGTSLVLASCLSQCYTRFNINISGCWIR